MGLVLLNGSAFGSDLQSDRNVLKEWIGVQKTLRSTRAAWKEEKTALERHRSLLKEELALLERQLEAAEQGVEKGEGETERLAERLAGVEESRKGMLQDLERLEARLKSLFPKLPKVLQAKLEPLIAKSENADPGHRFQYLVGALNEVDKFQSQLSLVPEMILLDGRETQVNVLYLGLAQAYYVDRQGIRAGRGLPGDDGWKWEATDGLAPAIANMMRIYGNEVPADFVILPVEAK